MDDPKLGTKLKWMVSRGNFSIACFKFGTVTGKVKKRILQENIDFRLSHIHSSAVAVVGAVADEGWWCWRMELKGSHSKKEKETFSI